MLLTAALLFVVAPGDLGRRNRHSLSSYLLSPLRLSSASVVLLVSSPS